MPRCGQEDICSGQNAKNCVFCGEFFVDLRGLEGKMAASPSFLRSINGETDFWLSGKTAMHWVRILIQSHGSDSHWLFQVTWSRLSISK